MTLIDRHVQVTVLLSMLVVMALTTSLNTVFLLADELGDGEGSYGALQALLYAARTLPTVIYEMLPFSALGGALIGLGILASNNELVVMQAAGVRTWRLVWSVMKPTLLIMIFSLVLGEYIAPRLEQQAQSDKAVQKSEGGMVSSTLGTWQKIGNEFIHINAISPGGEELIGVTRFELNESRQLVSSSIAETARYNENGETGYWQLSNVVTSLIAPAGISTRSNAEQRWNVDLSPELLSVLLVEPQRQSITGLYRFAGYFENEGLEAGTYFLAFWKKLFQPLSTAALVLLGVSFVFGPLRESTTGYRIFIAISIGLVFTIVQRLLEPASLLYGFNPVIAVLAPIVASALFGAYLLNKVR